ncbi:hypothetical protein BJV78DRAFT_1354152 [Lactifluus subvellereus]|nr:hypothetical protein BJV78DRAFT_1354152 [Lactifluus subvellereus]
MGGRTDRASILHQVTFKVTMNVAPKNLPDEDIQDDDGSESPQFKFLLAAGRRETGVDQLFSKAQVIVRRIQHRYLLSLRRTLGSYPLLEWMAGIHLARTFLQGNSSVAPVHVEVRLGVTPPDPAGISKIHLIEGATSAPLPFVYWSHAPALPRRALLELCREDSTTSYWTEYNQRVFLEVLYFAAQL